MNATDATITYFMRSIGSLVRADAFRYAGPTQPMEATSSTTLLWSITRIGRLTVVRLKFPVKSCLPTCFIRSFPAPLYFEMTSLSVSAKPPSLCVFSCNLKSSLRFIVLTHFVNVYIPLTWDLRPALLFLLDYLTSLLFSLPRVFE